MKKRKNKLPRDVKLEHLFWSKIYRSEDSNKPLVKRVEYMFPRLMKKPFRASEFELAGYFGVVTNMGNWVEGHAYLKEQEIVYCWNGDIFWFRDKSDRTKFANHFNYETFIN